ncbi:HAD hydrolase [Thelephora terrestris]|uniref:HAD hydrolase n=1 Tax=Thelephora terrestris TaxID=56493 RepID=A0A9P6HHY2_9AGAM|nr:HAD hydrolase [Thelephora terrestris]
MISAMPTLTNVRFVRTSRNWRSQPPGRRCISTLLPPRTPAFVFDIDGVLLRGETVLEPTRNAFRILHGENPFNRKIPYIFLTNGGGVSEETRCLNLSRQLGFDIPINRYIQSHTILKSIAHRFHDKHVLVLGGRGNTLKSVAHSYGFRKVYNPLDILAWNHAIYPFIDLTEEEKMMHGTHQDLSKVKFHAILVFHDPRNWGLDIQVMCDILRGNGFLAEPTSIHSATDVEVIFCNPDLLWKNEWEGPRLGQGGFRKAWEGVWSHLKMGQNDPVITQLGKPTRETYSFAADVLREVSDELDVKLTFGSSDDVGTLGRSSSNIYMIGDNPESDIAGANLAGWNSVLVHTGVYDPRHRPSLPESKRPTLEAKDVEEAVRLVIHEEIKFTR